MGLQGTFRAGVIGTPKSRLLSVYQNALEDIRPLAPYMRVLKITVPHPEISFEQRRQIRKAFDTKAKHNFVRWLGLVQSDALEQAGLNEQQINYICRERRLTGKILPEKIKACTVDHIIPIWLGGTNNFSNLCVIPGWINHLKGRFEDAQNAMHPNASTINILVPPRQTSGFYPYLPYFPDTFYTLENKHGNTRRPIPCEQTPASP